jgi:hypothetical protein
MGISSGLQLYAEYKSIVSIVVLICFGSCIGYLMYITYNKHYVLANNGQVTYKTLNDSNSYVTCSPYSSQYNCSYYAEYDVNGTHYIQPIIQSGNNNTNPTLGPTSIYYNSNNPNDYAISSIPPLYITEGFSCFFVCAIICAIINFYVISHNKNIGAVEGAVGLVGDVAGAFRRN